MSGNVIALTGATGFIGRHLLRSLSDQGYRVRVLLRRPVELPPGASGAVVGDLSRPMNMAAALSGVDAIVHSAGLAHAMSGTPEDDYRSSNIEATRRLAEAAAKARVGRFVFLSSIRAQTGISAAGTVTEDNHPNPTDAYGRSKLAAEEALAEIGIDWVALRPVLVYGAGVKGNMAALLRLARTPYPLPLASLTGRRSLISVENLSAAIVTVLRHEGSLGRALVAAEPGRLDLARHDRGLTRRPRPPRRSCTLSAEPVRPRLPDDGSAGDLRAPVGRPRGAIQGAVYVGLVPAIDLIPGACSPSPHGGCSLGGDGHWRRL